MQKKRSAPACGDREMLDIKADYGTIIKGG